MSEYNKPAQKENRTRYDWVEKVVHWELCKKFKFDFTTKWYKHEPDSVLENETHKILWDLEMQTDHLMPFRRPDQEII